MDATALSTGDMFLGNHRGHVQEVPLLGEYVWGCTVFGLLTQEVDQFSRTVACYSTAVLFIVTQKL